MMKFRGIIRRLDDLGRIVLPKEYRDELGLKGSEYLLATQFEEGIKIQKDDGMSLSPRKLDSLGRINITKRIREMLGIKERDELEMFLLVEDAIYIRKVKRDEKM